MRYMYYCKHCGFTGSDEGSLQIIACPKCGKTLHATMFSRDSWVNLSDGEKAAKKQEWKNAGQEIETQKRIIAQNKDSMILSTCPSIEGYKIKTQLGLVFGECLFKTGFLKSLSASFENISAVLSFGDKELSGTTALLDNAREYAINKMIDKAANLGANAIIGIDSESSAGGDVIHIAIMGTAVNIEPIE